MTALYLPCLYPVLAPVAALPYPVAVLVWAGVGVVGVGVLIWAGCRLADVPLTSTRGLLLAAGVCALAPVQTSFRVGQLGVPVAALIVGGLALAWTMGRPIAAGVVLGLAAAMKPQLALPFVALLLIRGPWRSGVAAIVIFGGLLAIGAGRLAAAGVDWVGGLQDQVTAFATVGAGDPTLTNPVRWQLLNLAHLLHLAIDQRGIVVLLSWGLCIAAGLAGLALAWRRRSRAADLALASLVAALSLLIVYHRLYDAAVLVLPMAWLAGCWGRPPRWLSAAALLTLLPFAVNLPAAVMVAARRGWLPGGWIDGPIGVWVLLPIHVWCLLALAGLTLVALADRGESQEPATGSARLV